MRRRIGICSVVSGSAMLLCSLPSCAPQSDNPIVGKWEELTGAEKDEFRIDGTVMEKLHTGETINGTYFMPDHNHIKVKFDGSLAALGEMTFPVAIIGNTMTMTTASGDVIYYRRVR